MGGEGGSDPGSPFNCVVTPEQVRDYALHLLRLVGAQPTYVLPEATA